MADKYLVECVCGAETDAPVSAYGQTIECQACGAPVTVSDATIVRKQAARPDRRAVRIEEVAKPERRGVSLAVEAAFGADEDEEEPTSSGSTRSAVSSHSPLREAEQFTPGPHKCVRCGRPFRGAWDEFETPEGTICYICSNLATQGVPERVRVAREREDAGPAPGSGAGRLIEKQLPPPEPARTFLGLDTDSPQFKRAILIAAIATVAVAYFVMLTGWGTPETPRRVSEPSITPEDIPRWLSATWTLFYAMGRYLVVGLTIYFVLWRRNALPAKSLRYSLLNIGVVVALCAMVGLLSAFIGMSLNGGGELGEVAAGVVYLMGWLVQVAIIYSAYQWNLLDFFWGYIFYRVSFFLVGRILMLIFGGLTNLVT